jgi:hypothetical protein
LLSIFRRRINQIRKLQNSINRETLPGKGGPLVWG